MATITNRVGLPRNLTPTEVDSNFAALNSTKQDQLLSGTNIRTVNGNSLVGAGDVVVQPTLVSGISLKTVNGTNLLAAGDLAVGTVSQNVVLSGTALTIVKATHDANTIVCTSASATTITLNTGVGIVTGFAIEQRGTGLITINGTATLVAPNGISTSGVNTTLFVMPTETTDTYLVLANKTSDSTLVNTTAGATPAINMSLYNVVDLTLTANCTPVFSGSISGQAFSVTLILRQDGTGSRTLTLPTTKWNGGTPFTISTAANAIDIITLMTVNGGTSYFGFIAGKAFA